MSHDRLDDMEHQAMAAIRLLQEEYHEACKPWIKIIMQVQTLRPHIYTIDGKTMVPILKSPEL